MTQHSRKESRLDSIIVDVINHAHDGSTGLGMIAARRAILELVRECVPENKYPGHIPMDDDHGCDSHYGCGCTVGGFLDCRTKTLENIEKL